MKSRTLLAVVVSGAFAAAAGANAADRWNSYEIETPSSVNESAPWLAHEPHAPASPPIAAAVAKKRTVAAPARETSVANNSDGIEYWLLGADDGPVGSTDASGASGIISFHAPSSDADVPRR